MIEMTRRLVCVVELVEIVGGWTRTVLNHFLIIGQVTSNVNMKTD